MSINWQDVMTSFAVVTGGGTVLFGFIAFVIKTSIKAAADIQIERVKSSLQVAAAEHQVRFTKLHEKRAEVIADLYKKLVDLQRHCESFAFETIDGATEINRNEAKDKEFQLVQEEFIEFYDQNQIYLPLDVSNSLGSLAGEIIKKVGAAVAYENVVDNMVADPDNEEFKRLREDMIAKKEDYLTKVLDAFDGKIPEAREALQKEFRNILGV